MTYPHRDHGTESIGEILLQDRLSKAKVLLLEAVSVINNIDHDENQCPSCKRTWRQGHSNECLLGRIAEFIF